jgi:hypothetical protein
VNQKTSDTNPPCLILPRRCSLSLRQRDARRCQPCSQAGTGSRLVVSDQFESGRRKSSSSVRASNMPASSWVYYSTNSGLRKTKSFNFLSRRATPGADAALIQDPSDNRSLSPSAKSIGFSERSLSRHFREETKMSFLEWQRQGPSDLLQLESQPLLTDPNHSSKVKSGAAFGATLYCD